MTQFQFDLICKIISNGAPVLAEELCNALDSFVRDRNALATENEQLKTQIASMTSEDKPAAEETAE
jgi:hypothetical protein